MHDGWLNTFDDYMHLWHEWHLVDDYLTGVEYLTCSFRSGQKQCHWSHSIGLGHKFNLVNLDERVTSIAFKPCDEARSS